MTANCENTAALRIVDHLRRRFARFKLCAHFLNARGQGLNLPLLQSNPGFQFLHNALLFEQLVCRQRQPCGGNAKLTICSYDNRDTGDFYTRDIADKAGVAHVRASLTHADANNITGRTDTDAGSTAQGHVTVAAGLINEVTRALEPTAVLELPVVLLRSANTHGGRVLETLGVVKERVTTRGGV